MIQHREIIGIMKGQIPYSRKTLSGLSNMIKDFPYFQTAHLLHSLNLLHLQDSYFLSDIRKTSVYIQDRMQLFFLIEAGYFNPDQIDALKKEKRQIEQSFEPIDNILSDSQETTDLKVIDMEITPVSGDYFSIAHSENEKNVDVPLLQHQDIIDKFLEQDAISPLRINLNKSDKQEVEILEPELEPLSDDCFFSETLAKIYVKQKKYHKALEIIHQLNLVYPEKNCYFADQIRFLEKLIINANKNK